MQQKNIINYSRRYTYLLVEMFDDFVDVSVLLDQFHSSFRSNAFDRITIVTTQEDAQINKLAGTNKIRLPHILSLQI